MSESPTVVGINRTQDGSIAVLSGRSLAYSVQKERFSRRKHHWGRLGDLPKHYLPHLPMLAGPVDLTVGGRLVARGELVDVEGDLGVRLTEVVD